MKRLLVLAIVLTCASALRAPSAQAVRADGPAAVTESRAGSEPDVPTAIAAHPALYPSERQLYAWLDSGYNAFASGEAHDDVFSIWGISRWYWLPQDPIPVGDDAALIAASCETPQLLATYTAWRGTRSALPEARIADGAYSALAQQAGYLRFLVVGLTKSPAHSLGLEYVLRVNDRRYGEPLVSGAYGGSFTVPSSSRDGRDYAYASVEFAERFDLEYVIEVDGTTYDRAKIRASVGYERRVSVAVVKERRPSQTRYLVSEIVDFPLVQDDGRPTVPANARTVTLEALAPAASYEVEVSLDADKSYLTDEPPMTDLKAAVTVTAGQLPRVSTASFPRTPVVVRLEELVKGDEFRDRRVTVCQRDAAVPVVLATIDADLRPSELRSIVRRLVEEGQKALSEGELTVIADIRGRQVMQGRYSTMSGRVILAAL